MSNPDPDFSQIQFDETESRETEATHPWRRYFARLFDISLFSFIALFVLTIVGYTVAAERTDEMLGLLTEGWTSRVVTGVASVLLALPSIAILQSLIGTPGKWLFGITVRNAEGQRLSMAASFHREWLVAAKGMGFGIPIVTAILMIMSHIRLTSDSATSWDEQLGIRVSHAPMNLWGYIKAGIGGFVVIALILYEAFSGLLLAT